LGTHSSTTTGVLLLETGADLGVAGATFAENLVGTSSTPLATVGQDTALRLDNSVVWSSAAASGPWIAPIDGTSGTTVDADGSCGPAALAAFGFSTSLTSSPFVDQG